MARVFIAVFVVVAVLVAACDASSRTQINLDFANTLRGLGNVAIKAALNSNLTIFSSAVKASSLRTLLHSYQPFTLFAPSNEAFNALSNPNVASLTTDPALKIRFEQIMKYHVLEGVKLTSSQLTSGTVTTYEGSTLRVTVGNGMVNLTDAFGKTCSVTLANINFDNGVIHRIDCVLEPELSNSDVLRLNPSFSNLFSALKNAGLTNALAGSLSKITLFAPSNPAMVSPITGGSLGSQSVFLTDVANTQEKLAAALKYHIIGGAKTFNELTPGTYATAAGETLLINGTTITDKANRVVNIVSFNITASNGYIHVIDGLLVVP